MSDGRLLDLYSGAPTEPLAELPPAPAKTTPAAAPGSDGDWLGPLWETFPRAVRERYAPRAAIGEGGMGVVVEAEDRELRRTVAIKGVRDPKGISAEARVRHVREARITARLTHPNIVPVFDTWTDARGNRWCSMLRVPGESPTLSRWLAARDASEHAEQRVNRVTQVFLQVCRAIHYAHGQGVLHRDLKPDNVLIGPTGEALVADWGVSAAIAEASTGEIVGTPGYSSPEQLGQLGPARADPRSDVYALGVMLRELLGGAPGKPLPARTPRELAQVIERATAREPSERYAGVPALSAAVEAYLAGELVEGLEYTPLERATRWVQAHALALAIGAALIALVTQQIVKTRETQAALLVSKGRLATADARNAEVAFELDRVALARHHAAVSARSRLEALPHREAPNERASELLYDLPTSDRLVWACTLEQPAEVARLTTDALYTGSRFVSWWRFPLRDDRPRTSASVQRRMVWGLDISPAAKLVATPGGKAEVEVFDFESGQSRGVGKAHTEPFWAIAFSPDGKRLATGGFDKLIHIWDPKDMSKPVQTLKGHASPLWAVAWSADGRHLVGNGSDTNDLKVWDVETGACLAELPSPGYSTSAGFDLTGRYVATATEHTVRFFRWPDRTPVVEIPHPRVATFAFHADGRLATAGQDNVARVWRVNFEANEKAPKFEKLLELRGHTHWISMLSWSADGQFIATASQDRSVRLWDVRPQLATPFAGTMEPRTVSFTADGRSVVTGEAPPTPGIRTWDLSGKSQGRLVPTTDIPRAVGFDGDGNGWAALYDKNAERLVLQHYRKFAPDGPERLLVKGNSQSVADISLEAGWVAATAPEGRAVAYNLSNFDKPKEFKAAAVSWHGLAIDPTGRWIATGGTSAVINLWSLTGDRDRTLAGHTEAVTGLAFSRDGRWLASGSQDFTIRVWNVATGESRLIGNHLTDHVWAVCFDAEAKLVAGGGPGGLLYLHEVATGTLVDKFKTPSDEVSRLALSPDGRYLIAGGNVRPALYDLAAWREPHARIEEVLEESLFEDEDGRLKPRPAARQRPIRLP